MNAKLTNTRISLAFHGLFSNQFARSFKDTYCALGLGHAQSAARMSDVPESATGERLKIMHLVVAGSIGGAERLLVELATRPTITGANHSVALISHDEALPEYFGDAGLVVHYGGCVPQRPSTYLSTTFGLRASRWLDRVLRENGADLLHLHTFGSHLLGQRAAARVGIPSLRTEHHLYHYEYRSMSPFTRWAAKRTTRLVAVSDYLRRSVTKTAPYTAKKIRTIRNGVDIRRFAHAPIAPGTRTNQPLVFAVVSRLERWKGVDLAIEGLASVAGAVLKIAGRGPDRPRLEATAKRAGVADRVEFLGFISDVCPVIAEADILVSGSDRDPAPLSVLETLSVGRPVIAHAAGGIPEFVEHGRSGWLVNERTPAAYATAMAEAAMNRAHLPAMGSAGRRFVKENCSIEAMCARYARAYRDTVAAGV